MTARATPLIDEAKVTSISHGQREPEWLTRRRLDAWRAFEAMPMPDALEEEWRRTDMSGFDLDALMARTPIPVTSARDLLDSDGYSGRIAQAGGDYVVAFTDEDELPEGVIFCDLHTAATEHGEMLERYLNTVVGTAEWKLEALRTAAWQGGGFLYVPRGVDVEWPVKFIVSSLGAVVLPHLLIVAEENSSVSVVQEFVSSEGAANSLVSAAVEIVAAPNARVKFVELQRWGDETQAFSTIRARLDRGADLSAGLVGLGGRLVKTKLEALMDGEGASANLVGLTLGNAKQHFNYATLQDHVAPHTVSDLLFKAALDGESSEVWYGTARVGKGAQQAEANQTSRNLLLSKDAKAAPIPVLEIETHDVSKCSHGASAGPLDEEQRFYLESRGIEPVTAERLLVDAFFQEVVDRLPIAEVRQRVTELLAQKLGEAR
jgi:Fe-S cluster assembly protein SufD